MSCNRLTPCLGAALLTALWASPAAAQDSFYEVSKEVNKKVVKLFGSGGFKGLVSYGTGVLVSGEGHILTVNNHLLDTRDLRVHLYDGRRFGKTKILYREPELDMAMIKIDYADKDLPHFDIAEAVKEPVGQPGDWVLAFSNQFQIATRDEPMSIQRGTIAALTRLHGRRGIFDAPFRGDVYFVDAIMNNPGAAGGALTDRKGRLIGIIGRELKNKFSDTWINYAVPIHTKVELERDGKTTTETLAKFVEKSIDGTYKQSDKKRKRDREGGYTGMILVYDAVERTPPYIEEVIPGSPAAVSGLKPDDLIVYVDGELITSIRMFKGILSGTAAGSTLNLEVQREGKLISITIKLAAHPVGEKP